MSDQIERLKAFLKNPDIVLETRCPYCGSNHDRATSTDGTECTPADGDISVCAKCGRPSRFEAGGLVGLPDAEEREIHSRFPELAGVGEMFRGMRRSRHTHRREV